MTAGQPEPWLRGPLPGIPALLQPAAHALVMAREDVDRAVAGLSAAQVWAEPGGAPSLGFHLAHLAGSTDRLFSYARGDQLSETQRAALAREGAVGHERPAVEALLQTWHATVDRALAQLAATPDAALAEPRGVGRARLPSTVLGLLFHAAEHASRHVGQVVTTARLARRLDPPPLATNRSMPSSAVIPVLVYDDAAMAAAWLVRCFGFDERLRIGTHRVQLAVGDGAIVATTGGREPASRAAGHSIMVRVADVDRHYAQALAAGAEVGPSPETYPYGERQYSARDLGGHGWTFSQSVRDTDPADWGGELVPRSSPGRPGDP